MNVALEKVGDIIPNNTIKFDCNKTILSTYFFLILDFPCCILCLNIKFRLFIICKLYLQSRAINIFKKYDFIKLS